MKILSKVIIVGLLVAGPMFGQSKTEPPVPVRTVAPEYPTQLKRDGVSGIVTVKCMIDEKGNVTDTHVEKTTNDGFDEAAVAAVKKWRFKPAQQDGAPVATKVTIPIKFVVES